MSFFLLKQFRLLTFLVNVVRASRATDSARWAAFLPEAAAVVVETEEVEPAGVEA